MDTHARRISLTNDAAGNGNAFTGRIHTTTTSMESVPPMSKPSFGGIWQTRIATPYPHIFATELWLACWALCSRRQLRRLIMVCRLFRDICLPLLFEEQILDAGGVWYDVTQDNWIDRLHRLHRAAVRLDSLAKSPHVGSIRSWKFIATEQDPVRRSTDRDIQHFGLLNSTYERVLSSFSFTLPLYDNLKSIHLQVFTIDAAFRKTLANLPRLENLTLSSCEITARTGCVLGLRSFTISGGPQLSAKSTRRRRVQGATRETLQIVSPEVLHALHLDAPREITPLLTGFGRAIFPHLAVLSLQNLFDLDCFFSFLKQCPRLESLAINTVDVDLIASLPEYDLPPDTIPHLRNLTGQQELFSLFTVNRRITTATILEPPPTHPREESAISAESMVLVFNDLLKASTPLLTLSIPEISPTLDFLATITSSFPQLQELSIHLKQPNSFICVCGWPHPKSVDTRYPILRDAEAFDNTPEDNISDDEHDEPTPICLFQVSSNLQMPKAQTNVHDILRWIFSDTGSLPPAIEVLKLIWQDKDPLIQWHRFTLAEEYDDIAVLSRLYPHLHEVRLGYPEILWKRNGASWRKCGTDSYMMVV
ncbi:hypothetical protein K438DRAFT_1768021 [Mycena galopus ATCC 62051]|nr:hypothetical protein K438DRAFT_1768021 [Mycena galopus ATCC 62051]